MRLCWLVVAAVATLLSGCGGDTPADGHVVVSVTLSRQGGNGLGPSLDHVPQRDVEVTVVSDAGKTWRGETDDVGELRLTLPTGTYEMRPGPLRLALENRTELWKEPQ